MKTTSPNIMLFGVGAFTQGILRVLKEAGASVSTYLTRDYAHYGPMTEGRTFHREYYPNPCEILKQEKIDVVIPMSLDWALQDWSEEFLSLNIPILCPAGEGFKIERERDYGRRLCEQYGIPFPKSFVARNKLEAEQILAKHPSPYVLKNTFCSPTSPIRTIVCETIEQTRSWLDRVDYREGVFLQQYLGMNEAGHIAFVSGGEIYSLVTNQEYKRAFDGNLGILAGAPLGGLIETDPGDTYGLAKELLHPLLPWFREVNFHGPIQVTAFWHEHRWQAVEYNIRLGVTCGPVIMRMLNNPVQVAQHVATNQPLTLEFNETRTCSCSLTLAGYGYPFLEITPPRFSVEVTDEFDCDVWWNEVDHDGQKTLIMSGHRIADVVALGTSIEETIATAYRNIKKISCAGSYYRTDIGETLWPPVYE